MMPSFRNRTTPLLLAILTGGLGLFMLLNPGGRASVQTHGGLVLVLEPDLPEMVRDLAKGRGEKFESAWKEARWNWGRRETQRSFISQLAQELNKGDQDQPVTLTRYFLNRDLEIPYNMPNEEVIARLEEREQSVRDLVFNRTRILVEDFGVQSPSLQINEAGRILVELPGLTSEKGSHFISMLRSRAELGFWETLSADEAIPMLEKLDRHHQQLMAAEREDSLANEEGSDSLSDQLNPDSHEIASEEQASSDPSSLFSDKLSLSLGASREYPVVGDAHPSDTSAINAILHSTMGQMIFSDEVQFLWSAKQKSENENRFELYAIKSSRAGKPLLDGRGITEAVAISGSYGGGIELRMNSQATLQWAHITANHNGQSIAIVIDGKVYSAPVVQGRIANGRSQITGNFTMEEAEQMAAMLKAGAMPVKVTILDSKFVAATSRPGNGNTILSVLLLAFAAVCAWMYFRSPRSQNPSEPKQ